jgi:uncharacterized membrane protein
MRALPAITIRLPATITFAGCLLLAAGSGIPAVLAPHAAYGPRLPVALAVALFAPGYLLVCTIFPGQEQLDHLARLAMSVAASFPIIIALTILLHLTPFDRSARAQLLAPDALVLLLAIAATLRQRRSNAPTLAYALSSGEGSVWRDPFVLLALAIVVALALAALDAGLGDGSDQATSFSLAMVTTAINPSQTAQVVLDVQSRERFTSSFYIGVSWQGHPLGRSAQFSLQPGQLQRVSVTTTAPPGRGPASVDVTLFKEGLSAPYRRLQLWMRTVPYRVPE